MELISSAYASPTLLASLPLTDGTVDVVVCCYTDRRWSDLIEALRSCRDQGPIVGLIFAVVDHNPSLAKRLSLEAPEGVVVIENRYTRGLSGARNTGVEAGRAPIVLFLDDDAVAEGKLASVLATQVAKAGVMGAVATIRPAWDGPAPRWFPPEFLWTVGCTYEGLRPGPVRNLIGAAMAVRRDVLLSVGMFDVGLGRTAASLPMGCEETALCIRASKMFPQGSFIYDDGAACEHRITLDRAKLRYLLRRCWAEGLSKEALARLVGRSQALAAERAYLMRTIPSGLGRGLGDFLLRGRPAGLGRCFAMIAGLAAATVAYGAARSRNVAGVLRVASRHADSEAVR